MSNLYTLHETSHDPWINKSKKRSLCSGMGRRCYTGLSYGPPGSEVREAVTASKWPACVRHMG